MSSERFDAIVIGGGPAGSTAGRLLAARGWKVAICEKSLYPAHKVCGEFLSPAAWPFLRRLHVSENLLAQSGRRIDTVTVSSPKWTETRRALPFARDHRSAGYALSRHTLDAVLLEKAKESGCQVFENHEVKHITREGKGFSVEIWDGARQDSSTVRTSLVVNASGRFNGAHTSFRAKDGRDAFSSRPRRLGFKSHFLGLDMGSAVKLFYFPGGYLGLVTVEGGKTNLCGIADAALFKRHRGSLDAMLQEIRDQNRDLDACLGGALRQGRWHSCGPLIHGFRHAFSQGIFHVGDAACFVEPFLGRGMTFALAGAFLLDSCLDGKNPLDRPALAESGILYERKLKRLYQGWLIMGGHIGRSVNSGFLRLLFIRLLGM